MGGEAWWATIHGVTKSRTLLSYFTSLHFYMNMCFQFSWDILRSGIEGSYGNSMGFPGCSAVKTLLAMQETLVRFLAQEDPLEKG